VAAPDTAFDKEDHPPDSDRSTTFVEPMRSLAPAPALIPADAAAAPNSAWP